MNKRNRNKVEEVDIKSNVPAVVIPEVLPNIPDTDIINWPAFLSRSRKEFYYIDTESPELLRVNLRALINGDHNEFFYNLRIKDVDSDNLKFIGVWDSLTKEAQEESLRLDKGGEVFDRMEKARGGRKSKYENVPKSLHCHKCNKDIKIAPGLLVKKFEKIAEEKKPEIYLLDDWVKNFVCNSCLGVKRGRKKNHNLPAKIGLKCKCGRSVLYPASVVIKQAEKKNITVEKLVKDYKCQKCSGMICGRKRINT